MISEERPSQETDFLIDGDQSSTRDHDSDSNNSKHNDADDLFKKISTRGEINTPKTSATDDEDDALEHRNDLKEQLERLNANSDALTADRIDQIAEISAMRRENKRFCAHCQKFKVVISEINSKLTQYTGVSLKERIIASNAEYVS